MGSASPRFTASTPAMAVVATAPRPGMRTARRSPLRWGRMLTCDIRHLRTAARPGVGGRVMARFHLDPRRQAVNLLGATPGTRSSGGAARPRAELTRRVHSDTDAGTGPIASDWGP